MRPRSAASCWAVLTALGASAGCAEPTITMTLRVPTDTLDTSCVDAVEVFVEGYDRGTAPRGPADPGTPADDLSDCVDVEHPATYAAARNQIAGQFEIDLPDSGLLAIDVRASTGSCQTKKMNPGAPIFFGYAEYDESGSILIPLEASQSCAGKTDTNALRPVDLLEVATKGIAACQTVFPEMSGYGMSAGTIHETGVLGTIFDPNGTGRGLETGVSTLPLYATAGPESCIAIGFGKIDAPTPIDTVGCLRRAQGLCTTGTQIEMPFINGEIADQSVDHTKVEEYGGWVVGAVWGVDAAGTKVALSTATVKPADAEMASVVYASYMAGAALIKLLPTATATDATGMFVAYVGTPTDFVVSAPNYKPETVRLGSPLASSASLVVLHR